MKRVSQNLSPVLIPHFYSTVVFKFHLYNLKAEQLPKQLDYSFRVYLRACRQDYLLQNYLLPSRMGILNEGQGSLQAFKLSYCIGVCDKLLYQAQVFSPLCTLIIYPLEQFQGFFVTIQSGFPHLYKKDMGVWLS